MSQIDRDEILTILAYVGLSVFVGWAIVTLTEMLARYLKILQVVMYG
jgi:hypothetical protein